MRLTWRDVVALPFMAAIVAAYAAYLSGTEDELLSSTRGVAATMLVLGLGGGCVLGRVGEVFSTGRARGMRLYGVLAGVLGLTALVSGFFALVGGDGTALAVLFGTTMGLWVSATARHAVSPSRPSALDADVLGILGRLRPRH
ncbi:hypothetical protein KDK95_04715 [Actinospica sp. MGRD01-02]|uniref:Uncharacterized protein n=1 Tax=Actinospica acidithermotolerans TaxID=2828514 RepID=A0A941IHX2_9ACTN|nr:hypothetical protein [Actinospica acidithermotolerans]MBR7825598.1 hypothetical protein [Actinospica acidithermotolerans]